MSSTTLLRHSRQLYTLLNNGTIALLNYHFNSLQKIKLKLLFYQKSMKASVIFYKEKQDLLSVPSIIRKGQKLDNKFDRNLDRNQVRIWTEIRTENWAIIKDFIHFFINFQTLRKDFDPIVVPLGTFEHEKVGKKKSHLSVEEVTVEFQALQTTIHVQKALKQAAGTKSSSMKKTQQ